ncbi:GlxA family transcriptional regulator [Propionicimonas sp.]|uniref:GlxA family transcriptional regulator n=1 Tax=Propionicimonas sp. TaxID=1955623 RepID=UPI00179E32D1|nr:helix-turn-helix domain-containing protein [Propionicimonas sp.]MBU3978053.1 helix-turn-helix domain-containing protein [Actinomycetota bacterium]MBA3021961.1 helix-turn-helix domain-containing protein [Propionicimonas sp.]MBU3985505.1 helix-turn-helix domain-containing protein [Actinomycetota bacterium]MBU4007668.1 helix-turn-helix domain-containing protein [Actinomycetota bacterium]MBU4064443.1 helix-turn-helix domain-containing protein [Actinomycetota bacterium]
MALKRVSVVLVEPVAVFEFGVPVEVFGVDRTEDGLPRFDFRICALDPSRPLAAGHVPGLSITATHGLDGIVGSDLVVVAATPRVRDQDYPPQVLAALRAAHRDGSTLLSLCSGAFILGAAGLLDDLDCTTHWKYTDDLQRRHPTARVDPGVLFVDAGSIITSAGTAAGIDACLHLVRRELGSAAATKIARRMVVPPQRDGGQQQYLDYPEVECCTGGLAEVLDWAIANLDQPHSVASLAARAHLSERTFARRFLAETGTTPHQWLTGQRVLAARQLLEDSEESVERVAALVGFNSAVVLRDHFRRNTGVAPSSYRRQFSLREA